MLLETVAGLVTLGFLLYLWLTWNYGYWSSHSVPFVRPSLVFGNLRNIILMTENPGIAFDRLYWAYPDQPAIGLFKMRQPTLLLRSSELVKTVTVKEFASFHDNDNYVDAKSDPITGNNPFFSRGEKWKASRSVHTPGLTASKLKTMVPLMLDVCRDMVEYLTKNQEKPLEAKYLSGQFTADVVASCVYGLSSNSLKDPDSVFRKMSLKIFDSGFEKVFLLAYLAPWLAPLLNLKLLTPEVTDFFKGTIIDTMNYRKTNGVKRNDFLQHLMNENEKRDKPIYTEDEIVAYTMTFFFDGYETSSVLISYALYKLAEYPEMQRRMREEVVAAVPKLDDVDFDTLGNMPYLDAFINETLRLYPPGTTLTKLCTKDITLECEGVSYPMKEGMTVVLPIFSIHRDPKYFPEPERFCPDRFLEKAASTVEGFFPFGLGPRQCLGSRFAMTQTKMALVSLLSNFEILLKDPPKKFEYDSHVSVFLIVKGGLWIKFKSLK